MQHAFSEVSNSDDIIQIIEQQACEFELDFYALFIRHPVPFTRPQTFFYSNYPQEWLDYYMQEDLFQLDPVLKVCRTPGNVWLWDTVTVPEGEQVFAAARNHGIYNGISCSGIAHNRATGILSYAAGSSEMDIVPCIENELKLQHLLDLSLAALIRLKDISMTLVKLDFSNRELEILKWTAEGKTSAEISLILGISQNTVNFHQKNMQKRFNAPNKTQIASYAAAIGLI